MQLYLIVDDNLKFNLISAESIKAARYSAALDLVRG
jgi:hypothetical protein